MAVTVTSSSTNSKEHDALDYSPPSITREGSPRTEDHKQSRAPSPVPLPSEENDEHENEALDRSERTREIDDLSGFNSNAGFDGQGGGSFEAPGIPSDLVLVHGPSSQNGIHPMEPVSFVVPRELGTDKLGPSQATGAVGGGISYQQELRGSQTGVASVFANMETLPAPAPAPAPIAPRVAPTPAPVAPAPAPAPVALSHPTSTESGGMPPSAQSTHNLHAIPQGAAIASEHDTIASVLYPHVQDQNIIIHPTAATIHQPQGLNMTSTARQPQQQTVLANAPRSLLEQNTTTTTLHQAANDNRVYRVVSSVQREHQKVDSRLLTIDHPTVINQISEVQPSQRQQFVNLPPRTEQQPPMPYMTMARPLSDAQLRTSQHGAHVPNAISTVSPTQVAHVPQPTSHQQQSPRRRSISLRLLEEIKTPPQRPGRRGMAEGDSWQLSPFFSRSPRPRSNSHPPLDQQPSSSSSLPESRSYAGVEDRGTIAVSWYEGTSTSELRGHVTKSVHRKLGIHEGDRNIKLEDVRIIDESVQPNEEIVLSPFIPDGSRFLLRFSIKETKRRESPSPSRSRYARSRPPDSPSAAPSPQLSSVDLASLDNSRLHQSLLSSLLKGGGDPSSQDTKRALALSEMAALSLPAVPDLSKGPSSIPKLASEKKEKILKEKKAPSPEKTDTVSKETERAGEDEVPAKLDGSIQEQLLQLHDLLLIHTKKTTEIDDRKARLLMRQGEKRQVVFVLVNYFFLFLGVIVISAEIHERAPSWMEWVNRNVDSVQNCSADRDALFECVSNGDFSGLVAAFIFWLTRSATTKQIFLFGFESPKKLWTVVYEAGVSALCWGTSYIFIRRGMNPDTRTNFLHKYWKDAVYGSLAGFNAAFMKAVLKNLIPQDQVLATLETRQLKAVDWLGKIFRGA